jgi:hypothetical protein
MEKVFAKKPGFLPDKESQVPNFVGLTQRNRVSTKNRWFCE